MLSQVHALKAGELCSHHVAGGVVCRAWWIAVEWPPGFVRLLEYALFVNIQFLIYKSVYSIKSEENKWHI